MHIFQPRNPSRILAQPAAERLPLFICYANCSRSVIAKYLYEQLGGPALSAGVVAGSGVNACAVAMLKAWGIEVTGHTPRQLDRALCDAADGLFVLVPDFLPQLLRDHGVDLATKTFLFADPFTLPRSLSDATYNVLDPAFDPRPFDEVLHAYAWMRERVQQIRAELCRPGTNLIPASRYLDVLGI